MAWKQAYNTADGSKRYRVIVRDGAGKKRSKTFLRSKDADAYMIEVTRREQLGHLWEDKPVSFGEFAGVAINEKDQVRLTGDGWFERYRPTVRESTFDRRKDVIRHLRELLPIRIDIVTPALLEDEVLKVQKTHPRQARFLHDTIKMILRAAAVRGQRIHPGVLALSPPSYTSKRTRRALTQAEVEKLADASDEPHLIRVAAYTGLRQGELFALRDEDIDLVAATIAVRGIIYEGRRFEHAKTDAGLRTLNVAPQVVTAIKKQLLARKQGSTLIFPTSRGNYHRPNHFDISFKAAATKAGLDITFHDLRHTFASLMVQSGTHPKVLQEMMGHASFTVTMNLYTHLQDGQRKEAAASFGAMLAKEA